ncbi:hypothetical protein ABH920_004827 [Catenulispora sp. EB89]|uniref:hypothetical protein n=1 Tax=Catenulispora sp. EB89 TaxID=3156257 RepID=UPI00351594A1
MSGAGAGNDGGAAGTDSGPEFGPESGFDPGSGNVTGSGAGPTSATMSSAVEPEDQSGGPVGPRDAAAVLQRRYRRVLMLLPRTYRAQRGEEILSVLLDSAPEQQRWPKPSEVLSLATHSIRIRGGVTAPALSAQAARPLMRAVALLGTLYLSFLVAIVQVLGLRWNWGIYASDINHSDLDGHHHSFAQIALLQTAGLLWLGAFAALLLGRRRLVQVLGWMLVVLAASQITGGYTALAAVPALIVAAALIATGGKTIAPAQHGRRWLVALGAVAAITGALAWHGQGANEHPAQIGPVAAVAATVAAIAVLGGWRRAEWAVAAAVVGGIAGIQRTLDANHYPDWANPGFDPYLRLILIGEAILVAVALYAIARRRRPHPAAVAAVDDGVTDGSAGESL